MPQDIYGNEVSQEEWENLPPDLGGPAAPPPPSETPPVADQKPPEPPQEPPITVPDVTPPADARIVERLASGQPSVVEKGGEKYFLPGSTPYESGFRTQSEYIEAQKVSSSLGPHEATNSDEPSVIIMRDNKPIARVTQSQIEKSQQPGAEHDWSAFLAPDYKGEVKDIRIPVKNSEGKEVLLTTKQYDRLAGAKDDSERLDVAKSLKLVPQDTTLKEFTANPINIQKQQAASSFETQQFKKNNTKLADGNYISNADLKDLTAKAKDDEITRKYLNILLAKDGGFDKAQKYMDQQGKEFAKANIAVPGGFVPVERFLKLKESNPLASDVVVKSGVDGLDNAYSEAKDTIGKMDLLDAIGRLKAKPNPKLAQAVELTYSKKDIQSATGSDQSVYDQFKYVNNPYPLGENKIKGIDRPYKPNYLPVMGLLGTAGATAEVPPVSAALVLAAVAATGYMMNKPAIDRAITQFRESFGRNPKTSEIVLVQGGQSRTLEQITIDQSKMPNITPPAKPVEAPKSQPFPTQVKSIGQLTSPVHAPERPKQEGFSLLSPGESDIYQGLPGTLPNYPSNRPVVVIPTGGRPIVIPKDLIAARDALQQARDRGDIHIADVQVVAQKVKTLTPEKAAQFTDTALNSEREQLRKLIALQMDYSKNHPADVIVKRRSTKIITAQKAKVAYLEALAQYNAKVNEAAKEAKITVVNGKATPAVKVNYINALLRQQATTPGVKVQPSVKVMAQTSTQAQAKAQEATKTQAATSTKEATQTREATKAQVKEATREATREAAKEAEITRTAEATMENTTTKTELLKIKKSGSDEQKRAAILASNGAIAWYQGQVGGKDRWDTIVNPYQSNEDYLMVLGKAPEGATIIRGPRAAYKTAKVLYGQAPKRKLSVDSGFEDVVITPEGKKNINIKFNPDPHGLTKSDITIGQKRAPITERQARIGSRRFRISPNRPRIGR